MSIQVPKPGNITRVDGVPAALRNIPQWILWKPVVRGKKLTKVPVSWMNPLGDNVSAHDSAHWGTFDQVVDAMRADQEGRFGIGFVLDGTGIICLDFDDHPDDDREAVNLGAEYARDLQTSNPTYVETSLQGSGKHAFYFGVLPHARTGGIIDQLNLEIYAAQFIAITGNRTTWSTHDVTNGQAVIDSWRLPPPVATANSIVPTTALGRSLVLTDADVIGTMMQRRPAQYRMMASSADLLDRSTSYAQIIGDLDKITGDPAQIDRIIRKCPFFKNAYNSSKYDQSPRWLSKYGCASMLEYWLKQARTNNTENIPYAEIMSAERRRMIITGLELLSADIAAQKQAAHQEVIASAATEADIAHDVGFDSAIARLHYILEDEIGGEFDSLTPPPGVVGEFVNALAPMLTGPRLTYVLPAVISILSGYLGQTFKLPGFENGFVNHFIIAGKMNTGKSTSFNVFNKAVGQALHGTYRHPNNPRWLKDMETVPVANLTQRVVDSRASSMQGLFDKLASIGAATWFADEAETQIELMSSQLPIGVALKAFFKQSFDKSEPRAITSLDLSRASGKAGTPDILNMTLPSYMACTSEVFQKLGYKEIVDGLYSRVNLIFDEVQMSAVVEDEINLAKGLPERLARLVQLMAFVADDTANAYNQPALAQMLKDVVNGKGENAKTMGDYLTLRSANIRAGAAKCVILDYDAGANALRNKIRAVCRRIGSEADSEGTEWPAHYTLMARTDMLPQMIAGVLATCDALAQWGLQLPPADNNSTWRDSMPQVIIREHHLQWAFEFVMHWRLRLFKAWDQGKVAVSMSMDEVVMKRVILAALRSSKSIRHEGTVWAPHAYVANMAQRIEPFKKADIAGERVGRSGANEMARRTLERMIRDGVIQAQTGTELGLSSHRAKLFVSLLKDE